ncbi:mechanosensitive ion channel family protein [Paludibaculum fermentans]|uniref:mechanosensitive ion channel family protein n=1 Tax=Paludibaculum fermentans TaxID=1473598 RepID=UPI003EC08D88
MKEKLIQAFGGLLDSTIAAAPKVVVGLLLAAAALLIAKLVERILRKALVRMRLDDLVARAGIDQAIHRIGIRQELTVLLPRLAYFLILLVLARTAGDALGLDAISGAIGAFFAYLPNIFAALVLLILGSTAGQFIGQIVSQSAESSGIEFAPALGKLVSGAILFVCAMMAIAQLKIDTDIVRIVTGLVLGGASLAFGLSFGLGTRDVIRNITAGFYARKVLTMGKPLEIAGQQGVLRAITATHIVLQSDNGETTISNANILDHVTKQ